MPTLTDLATPRCALDSPWRRGVPLFLALTLCACSSSDPISDRAVDVGTLEVRSEVTSVVTETLGVAGHGRPIGAHEDSRGSLVVVSATGLHRVEAGPEGVRTLAAFDPASNPSLAAFSPDGSIVAIVDVGFGAVELRSAEDGRMLSSWPIPIGVGVRDVWFEPLSGRLVVETSVGPVLIDMDGGIDFDATSSSTGTGRLAALPDGSVIGAIADSSELLVVGVRGDVARHPVELREGERLEDVRVAPNGGRIAVSASSGEDGLDRRHRVILLDARFAATGSIEIGRGLEASSWSLTNDSLVAAIDGELVAWATDGVELGRAGLDRPAVRVIALEDEVVVIQQDGTIHRWNEGSAPLIVATGGVTTVWAALNEEASSITTIDLFGRIEVHDLVGGELLQSEDGFTTGELTSLAISSDGSSIAVASTSGSVQVLDGDLELRREFQAAPYGVQVDAVAFDPGSGGLVSGLSERLSSEAFDDTVTGWSDEFIERFRALGDVADVPGCAFFNARLRFEPSGTLLAAATHDFGVALVDPATGEELDELPGAATVVDLGFSADGSVLVVTHDDGVIDVWDTAERSLLATYRPSQPGVSAISLLPEEDVMIVADLTGALSLIDVMTGETFLVFDGAAARTSALAVTSDGALVAAPTTDGTIGLWSSDSGAQLGVASGLSGTVTALVFSPDGTRLYSASDDGIVRSWSVVATES